MFHSPTMSTANNVDLPAFVLRHLATVARNENLGAYTIAHEPGSKHGDGFASQMLAVELASVEVPNRRLSLICKLQLLVTNCMDSLSVFRREVAMYGTVFPLLESLQQQHGLTKETGFFAYPKCYLAELSDNNESIIVLEDLRTRKLCLWPKSEPCTFEHVTLLLRQLGRYNGLSYVLRDQQPEVFARFMEYDDVLYQYIENTEAIGSFYTTSIDQGIDVLDNGEDKKLMQSIRKEAMELMRTRQSADRMGRFGVWIHGDCHINNMMFSTEEVRNTIEIEFRHQMKLSRTQNYPLEMSLFDWQAATVLSPAVDLLHFIFAGTEKATRDKHLDDFLAIYHSELTGVITKCGSNATALFSFDDMMDQLREFGRTALACLQMVVPFLITRPEDMKSLVELDVNSDDLNARTLATLKADTKQIYRTRLADIIADFRRLGLVRD